MSNSLCPALLCALDGDDSKQEKKKGPSKMAVCVCTVLKSDKG